MRCHAIAGARLQYRASTSASKSLAHKGDLAWQRSVMPLINSCRKNVSPASCVHATHEATCLRHLLQLKEQGAAVIPPDLAPEENSQPRSDSVVAAMFRTEKNIRAAQSTFKLQAHFTKTTGNGGHRITRFIRKCDRCSPESRSITVIRLRRGKHCGAQSATDAGNCSRLATGVSAEAEPSVAAGATRQ